MTYRLLGLAIAVGACSSGGDDAATTAAPAPASAAKPADVAPTPPPLHPTPPPIAPAPPPTTAADVPGTHFDDDAPLRPRPQAASTRPPAHPIDITLRTTPPGARATVDGVPIGTTPAFWTGDANGHDHEFTFVLDGRQQNGQRYAVARYRFVPVTSGIIHVTLAPLAAAPE